MHRRIVPLLVSLCVGLAATGVEAQSSDHDAILGVVRAFHDARARGDSVTISGSVAWVVGTSRTTGTYRDRPVNSAGAELMVRSRTAEGWRIRAIHWSSRAIRTP